MVNNTGAPAEQGRYPTGAAQPQQFAFQPGSAGGASHTAENSATTAQNQQQQRYTPTSQQQQQGGGGGGAAAAAGGRQGYVAAVAPTPRYPNTPAVQQPEYTAAKPYVNPEDAIVEIRIAASTKKSKTGGGEGEVVGVMAKKEKDVASVAVAEDGAGAAGAAPNERPTTYVPSELPDRYAFLSVSKRFESDGDWKTLADKQQWSAIQSQLFASSAALLEQSRLARLTHHEVDKLSGHSPHEEALLALHISRSTEKFRDLLSTIDWDPTLVPWLNASLLDFLERDLLEEYVDMMRHMKLSHSAIMEARGLLEGRGSRRLGGSSALKNAIARAPPKTKKTAVQWETPLDEPIIILAPGEHSWNAPSSCLHRWKERISTLGKVLMCQENAQSARDTATLAWNLRKKVQEVKSKFPGRPIVIIGMSVGAKVAIMLSFREDVDCLICIGLQMKGLGGYEHDTVDARHLFLLRPPTLFAIGSQSRLCPVSIMEQVRLKMQARNKLVIVRDADEALRIPLSKRLKVKLTQSMSDQLVLAEITGFVKAALRLRKQNMEEAKAGSAAAAATVDGLDAAAVGVAATAAPAESGGGGAASEDQPPSAKRQRTDSGTGPLVLNANAAADPQEGLQPQLPPQQTSAKKGKVSKKK